MLRSTASRGSLQRRSAASLRRSEGVSSLAQELASAIDDVPGDGARSLAAEFGLEFDESFGGSQPNGSMASGLDHRSPHSSSNVDVIPEWEEEDSILHELHQFDGDSLSSAPRPFMSPKVERDPLVELEDTIRLTTRLLGALSNADRVTSENALQFHLSKLLEAEKTREDQLRELGMLERELGRVNWDEDLLEGLEILQWDDDGEYDVGLCEERSLGTFEEDEDQDQFNGLSPEAELEFDPMRRDWDEPSSPTLQIRPSSRKHSSSRHPAPLNGLPATIQSLHHSTHDLLHVLHSLSDTLFLSSSMSVSSARQLKGIRSGILDWRRRDEFEAACLEKVEEHEAAEARRRERGGDRPTDIAHRQVADFQRVLDQYERRWEALKTVRT